MTEANPASETTCILSVLEKMMIVQNTYMMSQNTLDCALSRQLNKSHRAKNIIYV
jgi:hypothetical protein